MTIADRAIIVERVRDFYEAVGDSAQALHDACGCTLTWTSRYWPRRCCFVAGFPYYSLAAYTSEIHAKGYRLFIINGIYVPSGCSIKKNAAQRRGDT